ncbi:response regulator transcription factor [Cohnella lupini]|uniref:Two-component system response regulator YesN n=1 Tax=Cohnella lupini TaxID=1294267 RepID=A0A3D9HZU5_9BACL|nr:response regulator [Cohnella lupini]RED54920.1 two-component system response regulator YesN [Cohnella lupini]
MNILVADDENVIREGVQRTLLANFPDFRVELAADASGAADVMDRVAIDIVLTDILMPGMDGLEFMQISRRKYPNAKWVVISAHSEFSYAQKAIQLGARDYLLKPIGKPRLTELIETLSAEIIHEREATNEEALLRNGLKYLREAVFQRLASGLDIGNLDLRSFTSRHPSYYLIHVALDAGTKNVHLEHFIIENVFGELIDTYGDGFVVSFDRQSLLGFISVGDEAELGKLLSELRTHLKHYLKVPFQVLQSGLLEEIKAVPQVVAQFRQQSASGKFEALESGGDKAIDIALQYIQAHYNEELSLEKVAAIVFLNPVYFSQLFKQKTGHGYKDYVISLRLEQAKKLLGDSKLKLSDIAERIGYQDVRHFTQVFRKKYEMTPTEYRNGK